MHGSQGNMLSGILDTPTVWLQLDDCSARHLPSRFASTKPLRGYSGVSADDPPLPLSARLHRAFEDDEFQLAFQPFVDARSLRICGAEALLRWTDPLHEAGSPDLFVPVLEQTGLIVAVGEWVLREACRQILEVDCHGDPAVVSVNLAPRQFAETNLVDRIARILSDTKMPPCRLELEVTESVLEDVDRACATLHQLRELGVRVLLDDFGVGYSGLGRLKRLPVSGLKLDRSFVTGMLASRPDRLITESIIGLARELKLDVVAEGVEDREHQNWLREQGVNRLQGFLYSPAVDAPRLRQLVATQDFNGVGGCDRLPGHPAGRRKRAG